MFSYDDALRWLHARRLPVITVSKNYKLRDVSMSGLRPRVPFHVRQVLCILRACVVAVVVTSPDVAVRVVSAPRALSCPRLSKKHVDWRTRTPVKKFFVVMLHDDMMQLARKIVIFCVPRCEPWAQTSRGCATKYTVYPGIKNLFSKKRIGFEYVKKVLLNMVYKPSINGARTILYSLWSSPPTINCRGGQLIFVQMY